ETLTSSTDLAFLDSPRLTAKQVQACLKDLEKLPPIPSIADTIDRAERFMFLDGVQLVRRSGVKSLNGISLVDRPINVPRELDAKAFEVLKGMDWAVAMRAGNRWYDRVAAALRQKDQTQRAKALDKIEEDLGLLKKDALGLAELLKKKTPDGEVGEAVGDALTGLLIPSARKLQQTVDRCDQVHRNLQVAFALAAYQRDNRRYPDKLDVLSPKYMGKIPDD